MTARLTVAADAVYEMTTLSIDEIAAINRREERIRGTLQWRLKYKAWRTVAGVDFMRRAVQEGNESAAAYRASREDSTP